jgi:hypothetical protein
VIGRASPRDRSDQELAGYRAAVDWIFSRKKRVPESQPSPHSGLSQEGARGLISPQVFGRHIVLWDLFRVNFSHVRVGCIFHAADYFGLERLPLLDQFFDALGVCLRDVRQSLSVPDWPAESGPSPFSLVETALYVRIPSSSCFVMRCLLDVTHHCLHSGETLHGCPK